MDKAIKMLTGIKNASSVFGIRPDEIDEALAELKELMQVKGCKGCELEDYIKPNFTPNGCAKCNRNPNSKLKDHYIPKEIR